MPVKIRRNWPISTGLIASSKAFMNLPEKKELQIRVTKGIRRILFNSCTSDKD